jgi:hypothetical protein
VTIQGFALDRRSLLAGLAALIGASALPEAAWAQAQGGERYFAPPLFAVLDEVCAIIIPKTDTAGAREAGVPEVIDGLMRNWASAERRRQFEGLLHEIEVSARAAGGAGLLDLPPARRIEVVAAYDKAQMAQRDSVYRRFKDLVLTAYYLSEAGATQELRYEPIPGSFQGGVPVGPDTRAWAV